jgi:hypothetical protein
MSDKTTEADLRRDYADYLYERAVQLRQQALVASAEAHACEVKANRLKGLQDV